MSEAKIMFNPKLIESERAPSGVVIPTQIFPSVDVFPSPAAGLQERELSSQFQYVPSDLRRAGALLGSAMELHRVSAASLAGRIRIDSKKPGVDYVNSFIQGTNAHADVQRVIRAAEVFIDEDDANMREIREIQELREEEGKWLWRLAEVGKFSGRTVRNMRLSIPESQLSFARKSSISKLTLRDIENDKIKPFMGNLNNLLTTAGLEQEHPKVAQLIRLQLEGIEPLTSGDIEKASFGELARYFRVQQGYTLEEFGKAAGGKSRDWARHNETDKERKVNSRNVAIVMNTLGASEGLTAYMQEKASGLEPETTPEILTEMGDKFYFADLTVTPSDPFTSEDRTLGRAILRGKTFGRVFKKLRHKKGFRQIDFSLNQTSIWELESESKIPSDYNVVVLAKDFGFHVLDETAQALLDISANDRKTKHNRGDISNIQEAS